MALWCGCAATSPAPVETPVVSPPGEALPRSVWSELLDAHDASGDVYEVAARCERDSNPLRCMMLARWLYWVARDDLAACNMYSRGRNGLATTSTTGMDRIAPFALGRCRARTRNVSPGTIAPEPSLVQEERAASPFNDGYVDRAYRCLEGDPRACEEIEDRRYQARPPSPDDAHVGVILPLPAGERAADQCSRSEPKFTGTWVPSDEDIRRMESEFGQLKEVYGGALQYYRQYVGLIQKGKRTIYINAFPGDRPPRRWKEQAYGVCDGGGGYWGVSFDVLTSKFFDYSENGIP